MSAPSHMQCKPVPSASEPPKEDCRDYLRTGRCKYGASCKYNHPANVQSGGGLKAPIDPSEPMFPVRPGEPICQYYMKHLTCKFGQACKFNHPPQMALGAGGGGMDGGNPLLVGTGGRKNDGVTHVEWNAGPGQGIQMLPQRPGEANCIFFLKNGRCKYGATCRYHHPLDYHARRNDDTRRQPVQMHQNVAPKIHYVTQLPAGYQQGHFVVVDGNLGFISLDGSAPPQVISGSPQVISVPQTTKDSAGSTVIYKTNENGSIHRALGLSRDVQSSSSSTSIASSYETAGSNLDPHGDSASSLWNNRPRKTASGNSLNAYNIPENNPPGIGHGVQGPGTRTVYVQNADNPSQGLPRVVSTSSHASDGSTVYYDAKGYSTRPPQGQHQVHSGGGNPGGGGQQWGRGRRSSSFDQTKPSASPSLYSQGDVQETYSYDDERQYQGIHSREHYQLQQQQQRSPMMRPRPPPGTMRPQRRPQQQGREVETDEGLSMMTSALLTMLDTPEEAAGENYDYDDRYNSGVPLSEAPTPPMRPRYASSGSGGGRPPTEGPKYADMGSRQYQEQHEQQHRQYLPSAFYYDQNSGDNQAVGMMLPRHENGMESPFRSDERAAPKNYTQATGDEQLIQQGNWYPNWQDASSQPRAIHENSQPIRSTSNPHPPPQPHTSSDVGLYLP